MKLIGLENLEKNIEEKKKLEIKIKMRDSRKDGILIDEMEKIVRGKKIEEIVVKEEIIENMEEMEGEKELWEKRSEFNEKKEVVVFKLIVDDIVNEGNMI